jgi:uncharacterized protein YndB with AHSA1/START domain
VNAQAAPAVEVAALPPIVLEQQLACPPGRAFDYFTRDIARWWPLSVHSCNAEVLDDPPVDVAFEPRVGGGLIETTRSGGKHRWGTVTAWEPGVRMAMTWHPGGDPAKATSLDVTFAPNSSGTLVTLTHGGWDATREGAAAIYQSYSGGWVTVFGKLYAGYCENA